MIRRGRSLRAHPTTTWPWISRSSTRNRTTLTREPTGRPDPSRPPPAGLTAGAPFHIAQQVRLAPGAAIIEDRGDLRLEVSAAQAFVGERPEGVLLPRDTRERGQQAVREASVRYHHSAAPRHS